VDTRWQNFHQQQNARLPITKNLTLPLVVRNAVGLNLLPRYVQCPFYFDTLLRGGALGCFFEAAYGTLSSAHGCQDMNRIFMLILVYPR
jgi:hypothetical protein